MNAWQAHKVHGVGRNKVERDLRSRWNRIRIAMSCIVPLLHMHPCLATHSEVDSQWPLKHRCIELWHVRLVCSCASSKQFIASFCHKNGVLELSRPLSVNRYCGPFVRPKVIVKCSCIRWSAAFVIQSMANCTPALIIGSIVNV